MSAASRRAKQAPEILVSPVWGLVLSQTEDKLERKLAASDAQRSVSPPLARESASAVLARAHAHMLTALEGGTAQGQDAISELTEDAVALVCAIPELWLAHTATTYENRLPAIVAALKRQLSGHEHGVLSGELTYSLSISDAERPAAQMRQSLAELADRDHGGLGGLISAQAAAIALAALLLRAAGNIATNDLASEAPERRAATLDRLLRRVEREIVSEAEARTRTLDDDYDPAGHYLASALRVPAPATSPDGLAGEAVDLDGIREAWLHVAALEYIAVSALDRKCSTPTYQQRHETLGAAVTESSAKVLCGGRLIARASAFRHEPAWRAQGTALSHALEMYINGIPGSCDGLPRAQAMTLTGLVRAAVAIAVIDLSREAGANTEDGPAARPPA
ncbi:MAG: hypothetical protein WB698_01585 [Solirubrobacteraceae bacterium]